MPESPEGAENILAICQVPFLIGSGPAIDGEKAKYTEPLVGGLLKFVDTTVPPAFRGRLGIDESSGRRVLPEDAIRDFKHRAASLTWHENPREVDFGDGFQVNGADLGLQGYTGDYKKQVESEVPRRRFSADVNPPLAAQPSTGGVSTWTPLKATIDLWSLGVGIVTVSYRLQAQTPDWSALLKELDDHRRPALRAAANGLLAKEWDGQPLWMYVVLLVELRDGTVREDLKKIAKVLSYKGAPAKLRPKRPGIAVRVYFNTCAAFTRDEREVAIAAARMAAAHSAIWAAAADFERVLLTWLSQEKTSLNALEKRSKELLDLYREMQHFRTVIGALPLQLDILNQPLWAAIAEKWGLEGELNAVGARFDALDHLNSHVLQDVSEATARRLNRFVFVFTVASLVTFGSALVEFSRSQPEGPRSEDLLVLLWLGAAAVIIGAFAWLAIRGPWKSRSS